MRILHYFLGFPPYRTGGMTRYVSDLMLEQKKDQNEVSALWPGQICILSDKVRIRKRKQIMGINSYELINPLPVPLDEGIQEVEACMKSCDCRVYCDFLSDIRPDVIHIHTLMGMHKEFMKAAGLLGIRTVYTTHDYFGICPKVTLYRQGHACENDHGCEDCIRCNANALSLRKIMLLQSPLYRRIKNSTAVKKLRRRHRSAFFSEGTAVRPVNRESFCNAADYRALRAYYMDMLKQMDMIHFNSAVTETVYKKYFIPKACRIITITHRNIKDNRKRNRWNCGGKLKVTCLASAKPFKGFDILKEALDELWEEGRRDFELKVYSSVLNSSPYMKIYENGFKGEQLQDIMEKTDILVAPSIWYETFGFTVLEALSYGVPVIVSDHVGAKDIIGEGGMIVEAGNKKQLKDAIAGLTEERQTTLRKAVLESVVIKTWRTLVDETYVLYAGN